MRNYVVDANGLIKGGTASYDVDAAGNLSYRADVKAGVLFLTKNYHYEGVYKVDPALLDPASIKTVGQTISVGPLHFTVKTINPTGIDGTIDVEGQPMQGEAILGSSQAQLYLLSLNATAKVSGMNLQIGVRPASMFRRYPQQKLELGQAIRFIRQAWSKRKVK